MNHGRSSRSLKGMILAIFGMTLLGGCTHVDPGALDLFIADLSRAALSALLL